MDLRFSFSNGLYYFSKKLRQTDPYGNANAHFLYTQISLSTFNYTIFLTDVLIFVSEVLITRIDVNRFINIHNNVKCSYEIHKLFSDVCVVLFTQFEQFLTAFQLNESINIPLVKILSTSIFQNSVLDNQNNFCAS